MACSTKLLKRCEEKRVLSDCTNSQVLKKNKHPEALQELYNLRPEFNGKPVYFFYRKTQYREGLLIYDKQDRTFYVFDKKTNEKFDTFASWIKFLKIKKIFSGERSALATIFFEPNSSGSNLASLLRTRQTPYWKNYNSANIAEVTLLIKSFKTSRQEFFDVGIRENVDGISVIFFGKEQKIEKYLIIKWQENLISYELNILEKRVKKINGIETGIATERTLSEIEKTICYISVAKICTGQKTEGFEKVVQLRGTHLVRNQKNSNNFHEPFAILENRSQPHEAYRRLDCYLLVAEVNICENCKKLKDTLIKIKNRNLMNDLPVKVTHASQEILSKKVQFQRKKIANQNQTIHTLQNRIKQKVEDEGEKVSEELYQIAQDISRKELIRVQSGKANGVRYHPMFMRWAISVYSRAGHAAYEAMKGWQDKTARHILEKMSIENIGNYGRIGFFSHDSFKIQKGLLWSQRDNCYVGYLDFENEKEELQSFAMQCEKELQTVNNSSLPTNLKDYDRNLATQVHQIVWHSATCNFAYPIAYYGINTLTAHEINKILFHLAANLECIGIHTCGSVCDGAGENRNHIKSFDCKEEWNVVKISQNMYIRPLYDTHTHWTNYKIINPITGTPWFFISDPTHVFKKLRNNLSKSHIGESRNQSIREIMIDGNEVSWRHIQGVYDYTVQNSTAKITRLTKRHVWLTSWSKMRVDLAEHTLSKDVIVAMRTIDKLKEISAGTREFINYAYLYRQIFHSKKPLEGLNDSRIQTLKEIRDWISQDMLEGLFGTIRQLGGDSSTQTLKGYGHALNKFQVTAKITTEIQSLNYGKSNHAGMELNCLTRYDYRKKTSKISKDKNIHPTLSSHLIRLSSISPFTRQIFENLLMNDLFMGKIETPPSSFSNEVNQQNQTILLLQKERQQLFDLCLYDDRIISLLEKWKNNVKDIALKSIPNKKGSLWMTVWVSHLEISLNNYLCSGIWFSEFQEIISQNHSATRRLVAYFLIHEVIEVTFKENFRKNKNIQEHADPTLIPKVITLNQAESLKFSYIIGWVLFKLLKRDHVMNSHPKFQVMHTLLKAHCEEKVEYMPETKSQITNIIPRPEFTQFMYYLESLIIELFEKHNELGPNILCYVKNSLLVNLSLNQMFITTLKSNNITGVELEDEEFGFIYERCVTIYMKSRQKTWRDVNNYIPEKEQLRVWAQLEGAEDSFSNFFLVSELLWIIWAFGISTPYKRKQKLVPIIIYNLKNSTPFTEEALKRRVIFME
ncbi:hypothetical protein RhiirA5_477019 [Rhizophagus irregularis]|uniref:Uncharacterized protein n=1 Tax=Rhizophagus irregularis TaxID=588596 RepID=A0A2N0QB21_9GLOM|nr:hypothetical protein RhiirA5_477019 [Rhizophagus irregularis]